MDVISVPGRLVRDPVTRRVVDQTPVPIDPTDPSWSRFLADGDVIEAPEHAPAEAALPAADHAPTHDEVAVPAPALAAEAQADATPATPIVPSAADISVAPSPRTTSSQGA